MSDLTREQCEKLREWGLRPTIRCGDWFYRKREQPDMGLGEVWSSELWCGDDWSTKRLDVVKCPSTDELIEFALASMAEAQDDEMVIRLCVPSGETLIRRASEDQIFSEKIYGPALAQALYALIEKMKGEK